MKNLITKRKVFAQLLLICFLTIFVSNTEAAEPTNPNIIKLGGWSLEETYKLSYGEEDFTTYTYSDLQKIYNKNCVDKLINELSLQNNDLQYQQYCLQYDSICETIEYYKQLVAQYNALAKEYETEMSTSTGDEKDTAQQNMQQSLLTAKKYEAELASAVLDKATIYENRENCLFIKNNYDMLQHQQYISSATDVRDSIFKLKLLSEKYDLQGIYAEYAKLQENEQSINKSKDIAFQADVDIFSSDFDYYVNQQELLEQQYDSEFELFLNNFGISTTKGIVIKDVKSLEENPNITFNSLESDIKQTDLKEKQLEDKIRIINQKINILKEYYSDVSNEVKLAENEKEQTILELNKWRNQRKNIIKNAYSLYKSKYNEISIIEKKTKALHDKYIILLNKYNFGLTDKLTVKEAELNYMQSNFNLWNTIYEYTNAYSNIEKYLSGNFN